MARRAVPAVPVRCTDAYLPYDRVFRWWDTGIAVSQQKLTVIRVNARTVTVRTDEGSFFRCPPGEIVRKLTPEEDAEW